MRKQMLNLLGLAAVVALGAGIAFAAPSPGTGIYNTAHDLTTNPPSTSVPGFVPDAEQRLCAYCHTPHHAILVGSAEAQGAEYLPLWSHQVSNANYTMYASPTFTPYGGQYPAGDPLIGPSRLCMSCHDGVTGVDNYYGNTPNHNMITPPGASFESNPVISTNGNSNHPIGFSAAEIWPGNPYNTTPATTDSFNLLPWVGSATQGPPYLANGSGLTVGARLYQGLYMTCSSCHDVHNQLNKVSWNGSSANFFTLGTQTNSALCISCHTQGGVNVPVP